MAAMAFDTLKAARKLKEAGMPEQLAEAQAELMAEAFVFNIDKLVTQDYLDSRFAEFKAQVDTRFIELEARLDSRFAEFEARMNTRFAVQDGKFRLIYWMLGIIIVVNVIPALQKILAAGL